MTNYELPFTNYKFSGSLRSFEVNYFAAMRREMYSRTTGILHLAAN